MKQCPNCGNEIQDKAILCRYCHIKLDEYAQRQEELQYLMKSIENLASSAREDYEKEAKRISDCLDVIEKLIDASVARNRLKQAVDNQKEWEKEDLYQKCVSQVDTEDIGILHGLVNSFAGLGDYKDAVKYKEICKNRINEQERIILEKKKEWQYTEAVSKMQDVSIDSYVRLSRVFGELGDFKDSFEKKSYCDSILADLKQKAEQERIEAAEKAAELEEQKAKNRKKKGIMVALIAGVVILIGVLAVAGFSLQKSNQYTQALAYKEAGDYNSAKELLAELGEYKDCKILIAICDKELQYAKALSLKEQGDYANAVVEFTQIKEYSDSSIQIAECNYLQAVRIMKEGNLQTAIGEFEKNELYGDSAEKIKECRYLMGMEYKTAGEYKTALKIFNEVRDYGDSAEQIEKIKQNLYADAVACQENKEYQTAIETYSFLEDYSDSVERIIQCNYGSAKMLYESKNYEAALEKFREIEAYSDSKIQIKKCQYEIACKYMEQNQYQDAVKTLKQIDGGYSESSELIKECNYQIAVQYMENENYSQAKQLFSELGNYSDSVEQIKLCEWASMNVGNTVFFGTYEQDNNSYTTDESIEWIVLDVQDGQALLLSRYVLDAIGHNNSDEWSNSEIREWLQQEFYYDAFDTQEKNLLVEKQLTTEWIGYQKILSENTKDKVFLLSEQEVLEYLGEYSEGAKAVPSVYADKQGVKQRAYYHEEYSNYCYWSLRTPGWNTVNITYVDDTGQVIGFGDEGRLQLYGIRPAVWVTLKPEKESAPTVTSKPIAIPEPTEKPKATSTPKPTSTPIPKEVNNKSPQEILNYFENMDSYVEKYWTENSNVDTLYFGLTTGEILSDGSVKFGKINPDVDMVFEEITIYAPDYNTGIIENLWGGKVNIYIDELYEDYFAFNYISDGVKTNVVMEPQ